MSEEIKQNILFVCTGNSCRSIMAQAYCDKLISEKGLLYKTRSAGTLGISGMVPSDNTRTVLEEEKIGINGYISTGLDKYLIDWADVILIMEDSHKEAVLSLEAASIDKIHYLAEFLGDETNVVIPDPIGQPLSYYKMCFDVIKRSVEGLIEWLEK